MTYGSLPVIYSTVHWWQEVHAIGPVYQAGCAPDKHSTTSHRHNGCIIRALPIAVHNSGVSGEGPFAEIGDVQSGH